MNKRRIAAIVLIAAALVFDIIVVCINAGVARPLNIATICALSALLVLNIMRAVSER